MTLFDCIKEKVSLLDVIGQSIQLRQAGTYWKGPCPFHAEKDASFTVSPERSIFYCFGCHASGDVIGFIARLENMSQTEAAHYLVERYQLSLPPHIKNAHQLTSQEKDAKNRYFQLCKLVAAWAHAYLLNDAKAYKYLSDRSISATTIQQFQIGYFPSGNTALGNLVKSLTKDGFLLEDLRTHGIVLEGKGTLFSPFEERIIFPIKDTLDRHCGFGGRVFKPGDERPKYYNSKETEGFEKGKLLYGYDSAKKALLEAEHGFLVEGYIDCVMMAQHGFTNTVATLGTAGTLTHLKTLARSIETLYLLYDGDSAGIKAMLRLTEMCWEANLDLKVITLPAGHDPASFLSNGGALKPLVDGALDIVTFYINSTGTGFTTKSLAQKMIVAEKIAGVIARLKSTFKQDLLLHHAAGVMNIPFESIKGLAQQVAQTYNQRSDEADEASQSGNKNGEPNGVESDIIILEEKIFSAILQSMANGSLVRIPEEMRVCFSPSMRTILERLVDYEQQNDGKITVDGFINRMDSSEKSWVERIRCMYDGSLQLPMIDTLLTRLYRHEWQNMVNELKQQIAQARQEQNVALVQTLLERFAHLKETMVTRGLR